MHYPGGPKSCDECYHEREEQGDWGQSRTLGRQKQTAAVYLHAKQRRRRRGRSRLGVSQRNRPCRHLSLGPQTSTLWDKRFLLFKRPGSGPLVTAAPGHQCQVLQVCVRIPAPPLTSWVALSQKLLPAGSCEGLRSLGKAWHTVGAQEMVVSVLTDADRRWAGPFRAKEGCAPRPAPRKLSRVPGGRRVAVQPDGQAVSGPVRGCELPQPWPHLPRAPRQEGAGHRGTAESHRGRHITTFGVTGPEFKRKRNCESSRLVRKLLEGTLKTNKNHGNRTLKMEEEAPHTHAGTHMHTRAHGAPCLHW